MPKVHDIDATTIAFTLIGSLLLAGCTTSTADGTDESTPRDGGTLRVALDTLPTCLDPTQASTVPVLSRQMVDNLVDQDPSTGEIAPWLATSWTVADGGATYTLNLQDNVSFSNGEKLDARAVKSNFDAIVADKAALNTASVLLNGYVDTKIDGPLQATVIFDRPNAGFLQALSTLPLGMLAPSSLTLTPEQRCAQTVSTTGPFVIDTIDGADSITLAKRAGYQWPSSIAKHTGEARLDRIQYTTVPEVGVREGGLRSNQLDFARVDPINEQSFDGNGFALEVRAQPGIVNSFQLNASRPILQDERVRRALLLGTDRYEAIETVLSTRTAPATSILASNTPGYVDLTDALTFRPEESKRLLDEAGWTPGADNIRTKDGQRLTLRYISRFKSAIPDLIYLQWRNLGVELEIATSDASIVTAAQSSGDWDINAYSVTRSDPSVLSRIYNTAGPNGNRLPPSPLDILLNTVDTEPNWSVRSDAAAKAQRYIINHALAVPINDAAQIWVRNDHIHGVRFDGTSFPSLYDVWID